MENVIDHTIHAFEEICESWQGFPGRMEKVAPLAYVWHPEKIANRAVSKSIGLTVQAITHGNEVGGLDVLLACLKFIKCGLLIPQISLGFVLGNPTAARQNKRFINKDLNRAFGIPDKLLEEEQRARALEPLLKESQYFLDFHQTIEPTLKSFFIFPYTTDCFDFAQALHSKIPIVTHWGKSFSKDGMCTDEYVNSQGGVGITLELGQKGFDNYQVGLGLQVALAAMQFAQNKGMASVNAFSVGPFSEIYTWKQVVPFATGMQLKEGLINFEPVSKGQKIGIFNSKHLEVTENGWLLFPKYIRDPLAAPPKEIFRIMKRISTEELGKEGVVGL